MHSLAIGTSKELVDAFTLRGVGFSYRQHPIVSNVDLVIGRGELVCVIGANGSGKTTLLKLMAGLLRATAGEIRCLGMDPARVSRAQLARQLSFVPQSYRMSFPFRVMEVVLMGRYGHHRGMGLDDSTDIANAQSAMRRCDVAHLSDRRFNEISGGEQRRVLLAQAFCQATKILLLDEPTASLDPVHSISIFDTLRQRCQQFNTTVVVATHDMNLAARFSQRILLVDSQGIAADGTVDEVLRDPVTKTAFRVPMHLGILPDSNIPFVVPL